MAGCSLEDPIEVGGYCQFEDKNAPGRIEYIVIHQAQTGDHASQNGKNDIDITAPLVLVTREMAESDSRYAEYLPYFQYGKYCPVNSDKCVQFALPGDLTLPENFDPGKGEVHTFCIPDCPVGLHKESGPKGDFCVKDSITKCGSRLKDCQQEDGWKDGECIDGVCTVKTCQTNWTRSNVKNACVPSDRCCGRFCGNCYNVGMVCTPESKDTGKPLNCQNNCAKGLVACKDRLASSSNVGENDNSYTLTICVDPLTDNAFCGAEPSEDITSNDTLLQRTCYNAHKCAEGEQCIMGRCRRSCAPETLKDGTTVNPVIIGGECVNTMQTAEYCTDQASVRDYLYCERVLDMPDDPVPDDPVPDDPVPTDPNATSFIYNCYKRTGSHFESHRVVIPACNDNNICLNGLCVPPSKDNCEELEQLFCEETGTCVDPQNDVSYCGATEADPCRPGDHCTVMDDCIHGRCVYKCPDGLRRIGDDCIDPMTSSDHCGIKDISCSKTQNCIHGECIELNSIRCNEDNNVYCKNSCHDILTDDAFCGVPTMKYDENLIMCDMTELSSEIYDQKTVCATTETCYNGNCIENAIMTDKKHVVCGNQFVDPQNSAEYCGAKQVSLGTYFPDQPEFGKYMGCTYTKCASDEVCDNGNCRPACNPAKGFIWCGKQNKCINTHDHVTCGIGLYNPELLKEDSEDGENMRQKLCEEYVISEDYNCLKHKQHCEGGSSKGDPYVCRDRCPAGYEYVDKAGECIDLRNSDSYCGSDRIDCNSFGKFYHCVDGKCVVTCDESKNEVKCYEEDSSGEARVLCIAVSDKQCIAENNMCDKAINCLDTGMVCHEGSCYSPDSIPENPDEPELTISCNKGDFVDVAENKCVSLNHFPYELCQPEISLQMDKVHFCSPGQVCVEQRLNPDEPDRVTRQCADACPDNEIFYNGVCIDPDSPGKCMDPASGTEPTDCTLNEASSEPQEEKKTACYKGLCVAPCAPGTVRVDATRCESPESNPQDCGLGASLPSERRVCAKGLICDKGECAVQCPTNKHQCGRNCCDTADDCQFDATVGRYFCQVSSEITDQRLARHCRMPAGRPVLRRI